MHTELFHGRGDRKADCLFPSLRVSDNEICGQWIKPAFHAFHRSIEAFEINTNKCSVHSVKENASFRRKQIKGSGDNASACRAESDGLSLDKFFRQFTALDIAEKAAVWCIGNFEMIVEMV